MNGYRVLLAILSVMLAVTSTHAQSAPKMKMTTPIPPGVATADSLETRLGTLNFTDGFPDDATVKKVLDNLDFQRAVQSVLTSIPAASLHAMRKGLRTFGPDNTSVVVFEQLMDSKALFLTANTDSIYCMMWLDVKNGPMVIETPPNVLGFIDDAWFHYVVDFGNAGPDKGKGGKFLILPPGYDGEVPDGYHVARTGTYGNWVAWRGFQVDGDPKPAVEATKRLFRVYPLASKDNPPKIKFSNGSGIAFSTLHSMDYTFFEEVNSVVQYEPADSMDPETLGALASIGIQKGKPFAPDARMKKILIEAANVGTATARALTFRYPDKIQRYYPDSAWGTAFVGGSHKFLDGGARILDGRTFMLFYATGITPAMARKMPAGVGSQYATAFVDSQDKALDGGKTYRLHLPPNIPAKDFWSITLYDNQTRSMLQTDQQFPSLGSSKKGVVANPDTSVDIYFGPKAPKGKESNWIQTVPGKGWNTILRLYGPLEPWFNKTWQPSEIVLVE
ncbi:MAG: DUF1254 domain-containing protein [Planctomycetes bacterium]|nr:DUF1254 domain-containing protein [Planctomycetota bacterium]